jgi:hypothetical protein
LNSGFACRGFGGNGLVYIGEWRFGIEGERGILNILRSLRENELVGRVFWRLCDRMNRWEGVAWGLKSQIWMCLL